MNHSSLKWWTDILSRWRSDFAEGDSGCSGIRFQKIPRGEELMKSIHFTPCRIAWNFCPRDCGVTWRPFLLLANGQLTPSSFEGFTFHHPCAKGPHWMPSWRRQSVSE